MHSPLLSIVVPTHNRAKYATHALASLLSLDAGPDLLEIVVHDTSTNPDLSNWVAASAGDDSRLHYMHSTEVLDLTQNHNRALAMARGRYVCLIGDDDTILPGLLDLAAYAAAQDIDCLAPSVVANYAWPDFVSKTFGSAHAGRLYVNRRYGGGVGRNAGAALLSSLARAAQGTDGLPKLYHGLVKRSVLENIRRLTGDYVHGASPDVSAAIGIAATIESFVELNYPVTLPGASGGSNTGASALGRHKGDLVTTRQTARYAASWPSLIPSFYAVETVWSHAAFETLRLLGHPAIEQFNYPELYAQCVIHHRDNLTSIVKSVNTYKQTRNLGKTRIVSMCALSATAILSREAVRLSKRALTPTAAGNRRHYDPLETIEQAQKRANAVIEADNIEMLGFTGKKNNDRAL